VPAASPALAGAPADEQALLAQLRRASELVSAQRLPEAEAELLGAQRVSPRDLRVLKLLALVRFKLGRLAEAGQIYREAAQVAPEDPAVRLNLGLIALKLGNSRRLCVRSPTIAGHGATSDTPMRAAHRQRRPHRRFAAPASTSWRPRWSVR